MKIYPLGNIIQLEFEEASAGDLITSSRDSAVEYAKIVAIGKGIYLGDKPMFGIDIGDHVFVKAWAVDIITHQDKKYYFVNLETNGILAVVK